MAVLLVCTSCGRSTVEVSLDPEKFIATAKFPEDVTLELAAAEPAVVDPVAMAFDADGKMYVVEMRDYPTQPATASEHNRETSRYFGKMFSNWVLGEAQPEPLGRLRLLEDTDLDGYYEKSTVFAEGLRYPTSVLPWRAGVLVTSPPDILFVKDGDGDGKADVREVLFSGFPVANTQHNINGLLWGLDNWVYGANGGNNGSGYWVKSPDKKTPLQRTDFRFRPDMGEFRTSYESTGGFGIAMDSWGHMFGTHNMNHIQHMVIRAEYLARNLDLSLPTTRHSISDHETSAKLFQISEPETRVNHPEQAGRFSGGCGLTFYGGNALAPTYRETFFVTDVVVNVVHQDVVSANGPSFKAQRNRDRMEFLAGKDNWFRPANLAVGPDGALYLADMHRAVIEHPEWIPDEVEKRLNLRAGDTKGRIYRIVPARGFKNVRPRLSSAPVDELVAALEHENKWWRDTAQRLLVERQDKTAVPLLVRMFHGSRSALGRLHSLWALDGLRALPSDLVVSAVGDSSPGVRENAIRLAESHLEAPGIRDALFSLTRDPDARVRLQLALTFGYVKDSRVAGALADILLQDVESQWSRYAVLSAINGDAGKVLHTLLRPGSRLAAEATEGRRDFIRRLAALDGTRDDQRGFASVLSLASSSKLADPWRVEILDGLADGLARRQSNIAIDAGIRAGVDRLIQSTSTPIMRASLRVAAGLKIQNTAAQEGAMSRARLRAMDASLSAAERIQEVELLALGSYAQAGGSLISLLDPRHPLELQQAAARALGQFSDKQGAAAIVASWRRYTPQIKSLTLNILLRKPEFHDLLIRALETGTLTFGELNLDLEQRRRLLRHSTEDIKKRAARLFGDQEFSNRAAVVEQYLPKVIPLRGDALRGGEHYRSLCAKCHVLDGAGTPVGPDLSMAFAKSKEDLLTSILDPNAAIAPEYTNFMIETSKGELFTGLIKTETPSSITLVRANGDADTVSRSTMRVIRSDGLSLMPEGLEKGLKYQDLADLLAFMQRHQHD